MHRLSHVVFLLGTVALACAPGCGKGKQGATQTPADAGITRTAIRGPVTLTVRTDRSKASIAERFKLTVTAEAVDDVDVVMPQFGESLGQFVIRDFREASARPIEGDKRRWEQVYELDCELSGKYKVDPITVKFIDRRKSAVVQAPPTTAATSQPGVTGQLSTEPFELEVTSLLEGQFDPQKFRDVKGPVELPAPAARWYWWLLGGVAAAAIIIVLVVLLLRWRRGRGPKTIRIPPHQWAREQLRALIDEDLLGRDLIQSFYYQLNGIVRQYIELRFSLTAPEMTTQEFLEALRDSDRLAAGHKGLLERFMAACDMVKYARYQPGKQEIEQVFATARDFIEQTAERGKEVASAAEDAEIQESAA